MKKIVVTGAGGKLGTWVVKELLEHGYEVLGVDQNKPSRMQCPFTTADLNNLGEVYGILQQADAVVHLAAIPAPTLRTPEVVFGNNVMSAYHILEAASVLGMPKAVMGSSESIYGIRWSVRPVLPLYVPVDEEHPLLISESYGLSKQVNEAAAEMFNRRSGMQIVSLRFANILEPEDYVKYRRTIEDPQTYMWNFWSYVDVRDAAASCRFALEADHLNAVAVNITADDILSAAGTSELMHNYFPEVTDIREPLEGQALIYSNRKAKRLLGWEPAHSWRTHIQQ